MVVRKAAGTLTKAEKQVVKALLNRDWRNQDIQALLNIHRKATVNSARITEVKSDANIKAASDQETDFFIRRKHSYDGRTGLNVYDDERLIRAREAMILAVQAYNNPGLLFKAEVFSVLSNIAWTYLLHEYYDRKKVPILGTDGRSLLLGQMIARTDCPISSGVKNNLAAMKKIRDETEHLLLGRGDYKFFSLFQACCLNFDKVMCTLFGDKLSLSHDLSLALQFAKLDFEQLLKQEDYDIPEKIAALDAALQEGRSENDLADIEYQFRVIYTLQSASKSRAHIQFVRPDSAEGKEICNVLEKRVISDKLFPHKPSDVCSLVSKKAKKSFSSHNHTQAATLHKVRPRGGAKEPETTNLEYCIYHPLYKSYSYSDKWVDFLTKTIANDQEFQKIKAIKL